MKNKFFNYITNIKFSLDTINKIVIVLLFLFAISSCSYRINNISSIKIQGSETMLRLLENLSEVYMSQNKNILIFVEGGGSNTGFESLNDGKVDLAMSSRNINANELIIMAEKYKKIGVSHLLAKDAYCVFINNNNPIDNLSKNEIKDIYTCKINNWSEFKTDKIFIGEIMQINRSPNTGTYINFQNTILDGDKFCENSITFTHNKEIIEKIKENTKSIGYGSIIFKNDVKAISIDGIQPNENNIENDTYPLIRYLELYSRDTPSPEIQKFIKWIQGKEGQKIVKQNNFIPIFKFSY